MLNQLKKDLQKLSDKNRAIQCQRFFKTGKGEYGDGDKFIGISCGDMRKIARQYVSMSLVDLQKLINSQIHEHRQVALFILVNKYKKIKNTDVSKTAQQDRKKIVNFYLKNTKKINNWDLVDCSAHYIIGAYLLDKPDRKILYKLAKSKNLWEKRIAVISTFAFIRDGQFDDFLRISLTLLRDDHDLIHKAVGWMLREVGNRDQTIEEEFLKKYYKQMPRTMLRYAIEKFTEDKRQRYLKK